MACCGSNRQSTLGGSPRSDGMPLDAPDGSLPAIHASWLDPLTDVDAARIPMGITRTVTDGVVDIVVGAGFSRVTIRSGDKRLSTVRRMALWQEFPQLIESIAMPKIEKSVVTPPVLTGPK